MNRISHIIAILILASGSILAQNSISTLNVKGGATLNVRPTQTVVTFNITETKTSYEESIQGLTSKVDLLGKSLQKVGFEQSQIRTSNFDIRKNIVYDKGQREDKGFIASQTLRVTFQQNKEQLIKILNEATKSQADASIQIRFELIATDKKNFQDKLLKLAVEDARSKAELIATASGYTVSGIKNITYLSGDNGRPLVAYRNTTTLESSTGIQNFEAADLMLSEEVNIEFIIDKK